jgi:hypothetical protein
MAFRTWIAVATCGLLLATAPLVSASELLTSFAFHNGGGTSPSELAPVEFFLAIDGPPPLYYTPVGQGHAAWNDGESGWFDITPYSEPTFGELASVLTNGVDDNLMLMSHMIGSDGEGGTGHRESFFFGSGHDLAGNQLDFVRLDVSSVHIWTIDPATQWQGWTADVTYEFWGEPIPEPATMSLLVFGSVLLWPKRGSRRRWYGKEARA